MTHRTIRRLGVASVLVVVLAGCSGSSQDESTPAGPTTSSPYVANPLEPGHGFVQIGGSRTDFDGVICATGALASDPDDSVRRFGVYANFTQDGTLYAVSLTRYANNTKGAIPTVTDTALVKMQGDNEVKGIKAQRALVQGQTQWGDPNDPDATTQLITHDGDRYEATGKFGDPSGTGTPKDAVVGDIAMRCPGKNGATTTTVAGATTVPGSTAAPGATTTPDTPTQPGRQPAPAVTTVPDGVGPGAAPTAPPN